MTEPQVVGKLRGLVAEALVTTDQDPFEGEIETDAFLPDFLDSIGLTALLALIEEEWGFEIADEEIEPEIFVDLGALSSFVQSKLAAT